MNKRVEEYVLGRPVKDQELLFSLRELIMSMAPAMEEKFRYGIPFYDYYGALVYINPLKKGAGYYLGFIKGARMDHSHGWFTGLHNKQIRYLEIAQMDEATTDKLRTLLMEALELNRSIKKNDISASGGKK